MSTRISSVASLLILSLAGCHSPPANNSNGMADIEWQSGATPDDVGRVDCASGADAAFARRCTIERTETDRGLVLTVRKPDGGFHRLLVTRDGHGVVAADGAEKARVSITGANQIEVAVGNDRFRLPATVKGKSAK
jgi:hypothetical protein